MSALIQTERLLKPFSACDNIFMQAHINTVSQESLILLRSNTKCLKNVVYMCTAALVKEKWALTKTHLSTWLPLEGMTCSLPVQHFG